MEWVFEVERAYVAAATTGSPLQLGIESPERLAAASGAVSSRYLAVGTPRSLSLICDPGQEAFAALSLEAHRTWFSPVDVRVSREGLPGRVVSIGEALAADIVCVHGASVMVTATALRRGTHVIVLGDPGCVDSELLSLATVVDTEILTQMAAGFVDGRQLDELTVFRYLPAVRS